MNNTHLAIVVFIAILIVIVLCWLCSRREGFTGQFNKSEPSTEFMKYLDMGDHRTLVRLLRGNSGKTVLLLHNSPMNLNIWNPLFQTLQRVSMTGVKTPNLVAYDLRGHGTAWMPVDPKYNDLDVNNHAWKLDTFVKDAKKVYDSVIGGGKVKVCGFGFGGTVAQKYALTYPDTVEKLTLLQTTVRPMPGLHDEIDYLGGPNGWIAKNPNVTYLTSEEKFVQKTLCDWFYLPKAKGCPSDPLVDKYDDNNDQTSPQYNLTAKMWRQGSSTTTLQADKLLASTNLVQDWKDAKDVSFKIHLLAATDDPLAPPEMMTNTYTSIYNTNRSLLVVFDIVNGRHGFTIMRPDYIAGIICDECEHLSTKNTYVTRTPEHGF